LEIKIWNLFGNYKVWKLKIQIVSDSVLRILTLAILLAIPSKSAILQNMFKKQKKLINAIWIVITVFAVLGMIAFTLLPLIYYG